MGHSTCLWLPGGKWIDHEGMMLLISTADTTMGDFQLHLPGNDWAFQVWMWYDVLLYLWVHIYIHIDTNKYACAYVTNYACILLQLMHTFSSLRCKRHGSCTSLLSLGSFWPVGTTGATQEISWETWWLRASQNMKLPSIAAAPFLSWWPHLCHPGCRGGQTSGTQKKTRSSTNPGFPVGARDSQMKAGVLFESNFVTPMSFYFDGVFWKSYCGHPDADDPSLRFCTMGCSVVTFLCVPMEEQHHPKAIPARVVGASDAKAHEHQ